MPTPSSSSSLATISGGRSTSGNLPQLDWFVCTCLQAIINTNIGSQFINTCSARGNASPIKTRNIARRCNLNEKDGTTTHVSNPAFSLRHVQLGGAWQQAQLDLGRLSDAMQTVHCVAQARSTKPIMNIASSHTHTTHKRNKHPQLRRQIATGNASSIAGIQKIIFSISP